MESRAHNRGVALSSWRSLRLVVARKGWTLSNLAFRWGVSLRHVSRTLGSNSIDVRWLDAVNGLPTLTRSEARTIQRERLAAEKARIPTSFRQGGAGQDESLEESGRETIHPKPGAILVAIESRGDIQEGDEVVVSEVRQLWSGDVMFGVNALGVDNVIWFVSKADLLSCLADTGREEDDW